MFNKLFANDKAVSPVIGVMLMVVVTVILAAAVSSFAGSVQTQDTAPQAIFKVSADESDKLITIEHLGGDIIYKRNVKIEIASGFPVTTGYLDSANLYFNPYEEYLRPGDMATITVDYALNPNDIYAIDGEPGWGIAFYGEEIQQSAYIGESFRLTMIDTQSGQTIYSTNVIVNP